MPRDTDGHDSGTVLLDNLPARVEAALAALHPVRDTAIAALRQAVAPAGQTDAGLLDRHQAAAHGVAWLATYIEALTQLSAWAGRLAGQGRLGELEALILQVGVSEYLAQIDGGIAMSQGEIARLSEIGIEAAVPVLAGNTAAARQRLAELLVERAGDATFGATGLDDELEMIRAQFRRYADEKVVPFAHGWHLRDTLIPAEVIADLAGMGVFGLTIPEQYGGFGLSKASMVVVSEELSRGYIGVGSLGTRSEIAAELILCGGTEAQKAHWLPRIASGEVLPTAVFTEPGTGSDLGALRTRAARDGGDYVVSGSKTWITHAARAHVMTLLARTDPASDDWRGLSMFLAQKPPGTDADPFPVQGLSGTEIGVLGYRGMKEYELAFDGFRVPEAGLLGGVEGQGFKQLMQTFESARIQTAARAVGVAQAALEAGLAYALDRRAFGRPLVEFPRVAGKLAMMAVEIMIVRQLTCHAAVRKDAGHRCDLEAGMAKLLGARVAWAAADNALQIHGGNGFALEYPVSRLLCDARILNIFEGAAEIQAQVIARRLLDS
jgi:(2S)-methylsuccinyl-CoA dehydrogenase